MSTDVAELRRALASARHELTVEIDGRPVHLNNLGKVLWPQRGWTKRDLIDYYLQVSPWMLPHLRGRPLALVRYPDGIAGQHWFQKDAPEHRPQWARTAPIVTRGPDAHEVRYVVCDDLATLLWLAQMATVEIHAWSATADDPERADLAVFDIDPQTGSFSDAAAGARAVCDLLEELGLDYYLKTSGKRGIHIFVPVAPTSHDEVRQFVRAAVLLLDHRDPELFAVSYAKAKRRGRCFIDYAQNSFGKTNVAPYSLRATPDATVSTPFRRKDLGRIEPPDFRLDNTPRRLRRVGDVWRPLREAARPHLAQAQRRLEPLLRAAQIELAGATRDLGE